MPETQTAYAKSAFTDPTNIANALEIVLGALALPQVLAIIPLTWMPYILAVSGVLGLYLRTKRGQHPVAMIAPGEVKPVEVPKLVATQQGSETNARIDP